MTEHARDLIYFEIEACRLAQDAMWGEQNWPNGTGLPRDKQISDIQREFTDDRAKDGTLTWRDIFLEEVREALAESDPDKLKDELIDVLGVATAWIEAIERARV